MSLQFCSFCKVHGHRITTCNNPRAIDLIRSAKFKCSIALQYIGTGAVNQMYSSICAWFRERTVCELRLLVSDRYVMTGNKNQLVARAIYSYYFSQNNYNPTNEQYPEWFIRTGRYWQNIANGMSQITAEAILKEESSQEVTNKIPMLDGLTTKSADCPICFETETNIAQTNCGHIFCRPCITRHTKGVIDTACPCCRTEIDLLIVN